MRRVKPWRTNLALLLALLLPAVLLLAGCGAGGTVSRGYALDAARYRDQVHGAWLATLVANHTGLVHEGKYLETPGEGETVDLVLLDPWSTDDDTLVEWVNLHILETHGLNPTYPQIRDEWLDHLNHDIWVSTRRARDLMDEGVVPPDTGRADLNPEGAWSIDAQLETEIFGLLAPGMPALAAERATYFARITNRGPAVEASAFYAALYAQAFFESDVPTLLDGARDVLPEDGVLRPILDDVMRWHGEHPDEWRATRRLIREAYDTDPTWWAARVNFASTIMALLYGEGDLRRTLAIASLAGWDADNNATTSAGLLGLIAGYQGLPPELRSASERYYNEDGTGDLPEYETVGETAGRIQALAERQIEAAGGSVRDGVYTIPRPAPHQKTGTQP